MSSKGAQSRVGRANFFFSVLNGRCPLARSLAPVPPHPVLPSTSTSLSLRMSGLLSRGRRGDGLIRSRVGRGRQQRAIHHRVQLAMTRGEKSGKGHGTGSGSGNGTHCIGKTGWATASLSPALFNLAFKLIIHRRPKIQGSREHFFRVGARFRTGSVELGGEMECARGSAKLGRRLKS